LLCGRRLCAGRQRARRRSAPGAADVPVQPVRPRGDHRGPAPAAVDAL